MSIKIFNTLTRKKEIFKPLKNNKVNIFVCGVTEYDYVHLGHARTYSFYDTMIRFMKYMDYKVTYLQNITDVGHLVNNSNEDKVEKKAKEEKKTPKKIVKYYLKNHLENFDKIKLLRPDIMEKATNNINEIIEQIKIILKNNYGYISNGSVYFDVSKFKKYGKLSNKVIEELKSGTRIKENLEKDDPHDFALWIKAKKNHLQKWKSPWSIGYPGWHIEDTAIAMKHFGKQYDIHGGAIELSFPHHEAEIAQAETITGKNNYVKYWVHTGILTIENEKMSKSTGNFIKLSDCLKENKPEVLRLWIASTHYRKPLNYNKKEIYDAKKKIEKLKNLFENIKSVKKTNKKENKKFKNEINKIKNKFIKSMENDFNTPLALTYLFEMISFTNKHIIESKGNCSKNELNIAEENIKKLCDFFQIIPKGKSKINNEIKKMINLREKFRKEKNWKKADEIRNKLNLEGIILEDTKNGVKWKKY